MIKVLLFIAAVLFMCYVSVCFRLFMLHPISTIIYFVKDTYHYFKYRKKYIYNGGFLNCYFAHFGGGKTLSLAEYATRLFYRYNNKKVYDIKEKKWVLQKVSILSNFALNTVPFIPLESLSQIVDCAAAQKEIDNKYDTRSVVLVLIDEASKELNSREFKTNLNPDTLSALLTCRHVHMSIFYTAQKFKLVDALLRSVTQKCIWCNKVWRFMVQYTYDADELEYSPNPTLVKSVWRGGFFVKDKHYNNYDTLANVDKLRKQIVDNDRLTAEEILEQRGIINPDIDMVQLSKKGRKRFKK